MSDSHIIDGVNYGPLAALVGTWKGDKGVDKVPEPDGEDKNLFYETLIFEAIGDVTNAKKQTLAVLRYHQIVSRKSNDQVFHNETGYWSWDSETEVVAQSLTIPRGLALLAGGKAPAPSGDSYEIEVEAKTGDLTFGVVQSPFMEANAKTTGFTHKLTIEGDKLHYTETTFLEIYGKTFDHVDMNRLTKE